MTPEILIVLIIVGVGALLFMLDLYTPDVVAIGIMLALLSSGILQADEAFAGFGSDTVIFFLGLLIGTAALVKSGIVERVGAFLSKNYSERPKRLLLLIMCSVTFLSAFMSNTATAALFLPIVLGVTKKAGLSPAQYLLPMAFCSILSSATTLISTSTNIVVSGIMDDHGLGSMRMFELLPVGIPICIVGLIYMLNIAPRILPDRGVKTTPDHDFGLRPYLSDLLILKDSPLIGKTLDGAGLWQGSDVNVLRILRGGKYILPRGSAKLEVEDVLLVEAEKADLLKIKDRVGVDIKADARLRNPAVDPTDLHIVEALIPHDSALAGRSLKSTRFRYQYGVQVLALTRSGEQIRSKLSEIRIKGGDILLLQGLADDLKMIEELGAVQILGSVRNDRLKPEKARIVLGMFVLAIALAGFGVVKAPTAFLGMALGLFIFRCITPREAYREIDWSLIVMVGAILSVGAAMDKSGTAKYLASLLIFHVGSAEPIYLLSGFFILTVILTQLMSNQAAAVVVLPIAIQTAIGFDLDPRSFAIMIAVAASCSFLTPLEPACLLVYGPGGYKFRDFARVGLPLTIVIMAVALVMVPLVWPLK